MLEVKGITTDPLQELTLILPDLSELIVRIYFVPLQQSWVIVNLTYGDFQVNGIRIGNSGNILRQFQNIIPFGLACFSDSPRDPSLQEDFSSGSSKIFVLTEEEVQEYEDFINSD